MGPVEKFPGEMFLPSPPYTTLCSLSLPMQVHLRFFCGPNAVKSAALAKQQKKRPASSKGGGGGGSKDAVELGSDDDDVEEEEEEDTGAPASCSNVPVCANGGF